MVGALVPVRYPIRGTFTACCASANVLAVRKRSVTSQENLLFMAFPSMAMDMPQNEAYENPNLCEKTAKGASHFCYRGLANLIQLMAGRVNELWNVVSLAPPTFLLEPTPTQGGNHISSTVH